jgi:hypothetical protein
MGGKMDILETERDGLRAETELLKGAARADDERMQQAARRAGITYCDCDTPQALADEVIELRAEVERLREVLKTIKDLASLWHGGLAEQIRAALEATDPEPKFTKEWCMRMAALEGDSAIGAGLLARDPEPDWHEARRQVISDYSDATAIFSDGAILIHAYGKTLGTGPDEASAWLDAARRLEEGK